MRPIDADELLQRIEARERSLKFYVDRAARETLWDVVDDINDSDILDYAPVRHGEWKYYHKQNRAVCLACSFERDLDDDFGRAIACPNCGALMDGGKDDG